MNKITAILEFDSIYDEDFKYLTQGKDYYLACVEFADVLRNYCKYGGDGLEGEMINIHTIRDKFREVLAENDVSV